MIGCGTSGGMAIVGVNGKTLAHRLEVSMGRQPLHLGRLIDWIVLFKGMTIIYGTNGGMAQGGEIGKTLVLLKGA
jgi:hypothetical protein